MSHKAYLFNWRAFMDELAPLLHKSLLDKSIERLVKFGDAHLSSLSTPYDGEPLVVGWVECLENCDEQQVADFVLTKYYDPSADHGVGGAWLPIEPSLTSKERAALLGTPFGPELNQFDPGRMGAYFQFEAIRTSLDVLTERRASALDSYCDLLHQAAILQMGVYVTF